MNRIHTQIAFLLTLLTLSAALVIAQDDDPPPLLALTSPDVAHPVQFQLIAPGDAPIVAGFTSTLAITADAVPEANIVYVAIENTGWSTGVIGLASDALDPDAQYVALEVDADGAPVDGGLAFELGYDDDLKGFELPVLIAQVRTFGVFRVLDEDGAEFVGQTNVRDGAVIQEAVEYMVDPAAIFAPFVLECHIVARPIPVAEPTTVPAVETGDSDTNPAPQTGDNDQPQPPPPPPDDDDGDGTN